MVTTVSASSVSSAVKLTFKHLIKIDIQCVLVLQVLQESLQIPGTGVYLVYHSSETPGYMSTILIQLTPEVVPNELRVVYLRVAVEGLVSEKMFEADGGLKYKFAWDRRNAYNQKVYGIVTASGERK